MRYFLDIREVDNIYYERNSDSNFEDLNECQFLINFFKELRLKCINFNSYNFYIYSTKNPTLPPSSFDLPNTGKDILLFLSDETGELPLHLKQRYKCIFKPYIRKDYDNIYPFPLGYVNNDVSLEYIPIKDRCYNVFFSGNFNLNRVNFYRNITNARGWITNKHLFYWLL